ncbi:MAG: cysteate synthase [Methanotrichaceae archaeon]
MGEYVVRCVGCGAIQPDYALTCSCPNGSSLLRAYYASKRLILRDFPGIWKFYEWLPVRGTSKAGESSITYKSAGLARELGLKNLYISFSGYWPEKNASMLSCSFKDLEAPPTMQRLAELGDNLTLVVASAGNTARAFASVSSITGQKIMLFVPENALHRMWLTTEKGPITLVAVRGDYYDAILAAEKVQSQRGFMPEGGARNIARRDGMGTVMLEAALKIGEIPQHYFQAVGSGTGGISAWEAAMRLIDDGRFGRRLPMLHLAQNVPNAPIYYAWIGREMELNKQLCPTDMYDDVLFNRRPPYSIRGGVKDAFGAAGGRVYGITNNDAADAKRLFEESEGIDILNAPAVAVAALIQAIESGSKLGSESNPESPVVGPNDIILLNITGGGVSRLKEDFTLNILQPDATISGPEEAIELIGG